MKTILVGILVLSLPSLLVRSVKGCEVPAEYTLRTSHVQGNLIITFALDHANYLLGQPVRAYLGIENTGIDTVRVCSGWDPMNFFGVMSDSCVSLESTCIDASIYHYPQVITYYGECITVLPDSCFSRIVYWDGWGWFWSDTEQDFVRALPPPGSYTALAGIYVPTAHGMDFVIPDDGITLPITILGTSSVEVRPVTWGLLKTTFRN